MQSFRLFLVAVVVVSIAAGRVAADDSTPVTKYTNEDLDRMFGPVVAGSPDPVDKSRPEDWRWVEQFLDRQYARIDADRDFDLNRRYVEPELVPYYNQPVAWSLGYPASTWWNVVSSKYGVHYGSGAYHHDRGSSEYRIYGETMRGNGGGNWGRYGEHMRGNGGGHRGGHGGGARRK